MADARADLAVHERRLIEEFERNAPPELRQRLRMTVESGQTGFPTMFRDEYSGPLYLMQGLVAVVLLLCCVNVSGLMLSKLHERQREFAVRTAIGAGSLRLARQYLTESLVDRRRGRRTRRRGRLVWHAVDAAVLPHADAGSRHADRAGSDGVPGDGALGDRDDAVLRRASGVARRARQSGQR